MNRIVHGDNLKALRGMASGSAALIYIDPPFNTGRRQTRLRIKTVQDEAGDRVGFGGRRYRTELVGGALATRRAMRTSLMTFLGFLRPRLGEAHRVLMETGSLFFHIDPREVHYCKVMLDGISVGGNASRTRSSGRMTMARGRRNGGRRSTTTFSGTRAIRSGIRSTWGRATALRIWLPGWWARRRRRAARRQRMCGGTIVATNGKEKTGDATQKPIGILERIVRVHSNPGDLVLDFFAGSGTTGEAAAKHGRVFCLVDESDEAVAVMEHGWGSRTKRYDSARCTMRTPDEVPTTSGAADAGEGSSARRGASTDHRVGAMVSLLLTVPLLADRVILLLKPLPRQDCLIYWAAGRLFLFGVDIRSARCR